MSGVRGCDCVFQRLRPCVHQVSTDEFAAQTALLLSAGVAVLQPNYRGSLSFGAASMVRPRHGTPVTTPPPPHNHPGPAAWSDLRLGTPVITPHHHHPPRGLTGPGVARARQSRALGSSAVPCSRCSCLSRSAAASADGGFSAEACVCDPPRRGLWRGVARRGRRA